MKICLAAVILVTAAAAGCYNAAAIRVEEDRAGVAGEITTMNETESKVKLEIRQKPPEETGQAIVVVAALTNAGGAPVWVNKRMLWNNPNVTAVFRELWFEIVAPDGAALPFTCKVKAGFAKEKDYTILAPNESVSATVELSRCYSFDKKGPYKVQAFYQDSNGEENKPPANTPHLAAQLVSNAVEVNKQ